MESSQASAHASSNHRPKKWLITIAVFVLIIAGLTYWSAMKKENTPSKDPRLEELERLGASSSPVTTTTEERAAVLSKIQESSKPSNTSSEDRLAELNKLSN